MDVNGFYPLVPVSQPAEAEQGSLVPVSWPLVDADWCDDEETDALALLWYWLCQLVGLFFVAVAVIRHLQQQLAEQRQQAGYWQTQHRRAVLREAKQAEEIACL